MEKNLPYELISNESSLILEVPHSGTGTEFIPEIVKKNFKFGDPEAEKTLKMGVDAAVPYLTDYKKQIDTEKYSGVINKSYRVFADPNRDLNELGGDAINEDVIREPNGHGLIWTKSAGRVDDLKAANQAVISELLKQPYTREEIDEILNTMYFPYIEAVRKAIKNSLKKTGLAIVCSLHSIPPFQPARLKTGINKGTYVFGPKARRGKVENLEDIMAGKVPDLFMIPNGGLSCHPCKSQLIR